MAGKDQTVSGMAGRYATALFELARENDAIDAVSADLDRFNVLVAQNPDLDRLIRSPVFGAEEQTRAIGAILERMGLGGISANFLKVVASNRRLFAIGDMIRGFAALAARHRGEVTAQVTVAEKLGDAHLQSIREALKSVSGKDVQIDVRIDPAIIGGLVVKLGSRMVDASLKTKLNSIRHAMKEVH